MSEAAAAQPDAARSAFEAIIRLLPRLNADLRRELQVKLREMDDRAPDVSAVIG